mgnify:CR=1
MSLSDINELLISSLKVLNNIKDLDLTFKSFLNPLQVLLSLIEILDKLNISKNNNNTPTPDI